MHQHHGSAHCLTPNKPDFLGSIIAFKYPPIRSKTCVPLTWWYWNKCSSNSLTLQWVGLYMFFRLPIIAAWVTAQLDSSNSIEARSLLGAVTLNLNASGYLHSGRLILCLFSVFLLSRSFHLAKQGKGHHIFWLLPPNRTAGKLWKACGEPWITLRTHKNRKATCWRRGNGLWKVGTR